MAASAARAAGAALAGGGTVRAGAGADPVSLALATVPGSVPLPFPPRDETYSFRLELEQIYRTELGRTAVTNYFDVEGDLVWVQEYMRYRVNGCAHLDAVQKVFDQIDRGTIAAVCSPVPGSRVPFPPQAESADFREQLDAKYRDGLRRAPSPSFVDAEGAIVWTQEYLRYRVYACDDPTARAAVRAQIRGGPPPPECFTPQAPERGVLGHWVGTIFMPEPRAFTMDITQQSGSHYAGTYRDIAFGTVTLTWDGGDRVEFFVYFGDGSGLFRGTFSDPDRVRGTMKYDKIARTLDFDMSRY